MTDTEYQIVSSLSKLRIAVSAVRDSFTHEEPNKTRALSVIANLDLMISHLEDIVDSSITGE